MRTSIFRRITKVLLVILLANTLIFSAETSKKNLGNNVKDTLSEKKSFEYFLQKYSFKKLFLVFAGPYPESPTSSFGHIFVLLEPNINRPFLMWPTIDFSASTENVGSFEFFLKGIFGGLTGKYRIVPFFEKYREYTFIESRPLWLFPFHLNEKEKEKFLLNVFKLKKGSFPYQFGNKNCASQIDSLFRISLNVPFTSNRFLFFPKTIINNWKNRIGKPLYIESMNNIVSDNLNKINANLLNTKHDLTNLSNPEIALLLNILEWKYSHESEHLKEKQIELLQKLRIIVSASNDSTINIFKKYNKVFNLHPSIYVGGGLNLIHSNSVEYLLSFRFGLHEFYENTSVYPANDYLSLLKMEIGLRKNKIRLNEFLLFNQLSLQPISPLSNYISWRIGFGVERKLEYLNDPIAYGLFNGVGYSFPVAKNIFNLSILMNVSPLYVQHYGFSFLFGPELILQINISHYIKFMNIFRNTFTSRKNLENSFYNEANLGIELSQLVNVLFQFKYTKNDYWYSTKFNFYIN